MVMVHTGNDFALSSRDKIIGEAHQTDPAAISAQSGNAGSAVIRDWWENVIYAALPQTVAGLSIGIPYISVACQGWVAGIVSVDDAHASRFRSITSTAYYFIVLFLQFVPFSLAIGAGIRCGVDTYRHNTQVSWKVWKYRMPAPSLKDLGIVFCTSLPLFLLASGFEFLSSWN